MNHLQTKAVTWSLIIIGWTLISSAQGEDFPLPCRLALSPEAPSVPTAPSPLPGEDPKDFHPEGLDLTDLRIGKIWNTLPIGLRRLMIDGTRKERSQLTTHLIAQYGDANPSTLIEATLSLQSEIESLEQGHQDEILAIIKEMLESRYGEFLPDLSIRIGRDLTVPEKPVDDPNHLIPELPESMDEGMIYRTEIRNLWLQGEGWIGMREFIFHFAPELDRVVPGLSKKYQELARLYRLGQFNQWDWTPSTEDNDGISREMTNLGRKIVTSRYQVLRTASGPQVQLKDIQGIATGRNAWTAAYQARKAASQMVTPAEGVFRWMMPPKRRNRLDQATHSARAEIRQGVFGPSMVTALKKRIDRLRPPQKEEPSAEYLEETDDIMDGLFSLSPDLFSEAMALLFESDFETNSEHRKRTRLFLEEFEILSRF